MNTLAAFDKYKTILKCHCIKFRFMLNIFVGTAVVSL